MSFEIDPNHSHVTFSIRHLMVSNVRGTFNVIRGELHIDEQQPANSWVVAEAEAASINTRNEQRDAHLRSGDFFEADKYPTLTFKSTQVEHVEGSEYKVTGDITIHGVTRPATFEVEYHGQSNHPMMGVRTGLTAKTKINRKDFNLAYGSVAEAGQVLLSEHVNIEIDLEAVQKPVEAATAAQ
ncbi:MAG: polyisoprenoid-binding protein [Chloroflexi bacterium]|jgi:polyisoprenoid-binding protein YceI|nr:polyisoprenoid-binding protein [Chloroflexota bacterium]